MKAIGMRDRNFAITFTILLIAATPAWAFHDGGVATCSMCHTMHNSEHGFPVNPALPSNNYLLRSNSPSDLCLSCHATKTEQSGAWVRSLLRQNAAEGILYFHQQLISITLQTDSSFRCLGVMEFTMSSLHPWDLVPIQCMSRRRAAHIRHRNLADELPRSSWRFEFQDAMEYWRCASREFHICVSRARC